MLFGSRCDLMWGLGSPISMSMGDILECVFVVAILFFFVSGLWEEVNKEESFWTEVGGCSVWIDILYYSREFWTVWAGARCA